MKTPTLLEFDNPEGIRFSFAPVKLVREAEYVLCEGCGVIGWTHDGTPWKISSTKAMHDRGIGSMGPGHKTQYARLAGILNTLTGVSA